MEKLISFLRSKTLLSVFKRLREVFNNLFNKLRQSKLLIESMVFVILVFVFILSSVAPLNFQQNTVVKILPGVSVTAAAKLLHQSDIIKSEGLFSTFVLFFGGDKSLIAGDYLFKEAAPVWQIAYRMARGKFGLDLIKVTIPEGTNSSQIAAKLSLLFPNLDNKTFSDLAKTKEGYLFPDTYFFSPQVTSEEVVLQMQQSFEAHLVPLEDEIDKSSRSLHEIITMASILEEEAKTTEDRKIVSGILWKRIENGMRLQVDAPFLYINGKKGNQLKKADLQINSPYNTYLNKGLPPTPISNPGLDAILAALRPVDSDYLFYLSDKNQTIHYAKSYQEHLQNIQKYLRS